MSLKAMRKAAGMTQTQAANHFGIKYRTYQNYENGVTSPDMDTAARFARYFSCTIGDLFDLQEGQGGSLVGDEKDLLDLYRAMSNDGRETLLIVARGLAEKFRK